MAKIIIIEDESSLLDVYSAILESEGHEVLKETDGEAGLERALNDKWDLMFLDIMLPRFDGIEVLKVLKEKGIAEDRPVIMLTNLDSDNIINECLNLGARENVSKASIEPSKLVEIVKKYIK